MNKRLARRYRFWFPVLTGGIVLWLLLAARGRAPAPAALAMDALSLRRLELPPPPRRIGTHELSGRVLAPDGRPVETCLVASLAAGHARWDYTDAAGYFLLSEVPTGEHRLSLIVEGFPPTEYVLAVPHAGALELVLDPALPELVLLPDLLRSDLVGRIQAAEGSPVDGCQVVLEPHPDVLLEAGLARRRVRIVGDGLFRVPQLVHGRYVLHVLPPFAGAGLLPQLTAHELVHSASTDAPFVTLACGALSGRVLDAQQRPLEGVILMARPLAQGGMERNTQTDVDGVWTLPWLPPGEYELLARAGEERSSRTLEIVAGVQTFADFALGD